MNNDQSTYQPPDPTGYFVAMLSRLTELGMEMAERIAAESREAESRRRFATSAAKAEAEPATVPDQHALAFTRVTRTVSQCMALCLKFQKELRERERQDAAEPGEEERKPRRRKQLKRLVRDAIKHDGARSRRGDPTALYGVLNDRAEDDDIERDLIRSPLGELVQRICRDLGVEPDWELWENDYWAVEEARLQMPGSPYARPVEKAPPAPNIRSPVPRNGEGRASSG